MLLHISNFSVSDFFLYFLLAFFLPYLLILLNDTHSNFVNVGSSRSSRNSTSFSSFVQAGVTVVPLAGLLLGADCGLEKRQISEGDTTTTQLHEMGIVDEKKH